MALQSLVLVAADLANGALIQPFGPILPGRFHHLVYPETLRDRSDMAALQNWLRVVVGKGAPQRDENPR